MTQEDKQLLLKDLCARLPYGVVCYNSDTESNFKLCDTADIDSGYPTFDYGYGELETVKPYLRPMSSMTEKEKNDYLNTFKKSIIGTDEEDGRVWTVDSIDYLNAHHFDYRGLIEKGLAIEAPKGMYD